MSKTIWKYQLPIDGQTIQISEYIVEILHIEAQYGVPCLWAVVDPDRPREGYTEVVAWGTGWPLPDDIWRECDYWGSCVDGAGYVWHYFAEARFPERKTYVADLELKYVPSEDGYPLSTADSISKAISADDCLVFSGNADKLTINWDELNKLTSTTTTDLGRVTATISSYL